MYIYIYMYIYMHTYTYIAVTRKQLIVLRAFIYNCISLSMYVWVCVPTLLEARGSSLTSTPPRRSLLLARREVRSLD